MNFVIIGTVRWERVLPVGKVRIKEATPVRYGRCLVKRTNLSPTMFDTLLYAFYSRPFTDQDGVGFLVRENSGSWALIYFIRSNPTFRTVFEPRTGEFIRLEISEPRVTPFVLDTRFRTLEVFGSKSDLGELVTELGRISHHKLVVDDVQMDIDKILRNLLRGGIDFSIKYIRLREVEIASGVVATCTVRVDEISHGLEVANRFSDSVTALSFAIRLYDMKASISVNRDGAFNIGIDLDEEPSAYDRIKELLLEALAWEKSRE